MDMRKVALKDLGAPVRSFLSKVGKGIVVHDERGRARYSVITYQAVSTKEREAALKRLGKLQKKVGKMMERTGKTEEELDGILQEESKSLRSKESRTK